MDIFNHSAPTQDVALPDDVPLKIPDSLLYLLRYLCLLDQPGDSIQAKDALNIELFVEAFSGYLELLVGSHLSSAAHVVAEEISQATPAVDYDSGEEVFAVAKVEVSVSLNLGSEIFSVLLDRFAWQSSSIFLVLLQLAVEVPHHQLVLNKVLPVRENHSQ